MTPRVVGGLLSLLGVLAATDGRRATTHGPANAGSLHEAIRADTIVVTVRAIGSTLQFVPPRLSIKSGAPVRLRLVNEGTLPHNIVLPRDDADIDALTLAAYQAPETGYVPPALTGKLLWYSRLASPGETVEVRFVAPSPGEYTYICLFPGHANSMIGTLRSLR